MNLSCEERRQQVATLTEEFFFSREEHSEHFKLCEDCQNWLSSHIGIHDLDDYLKAIGSLPEDAWQAYFKEVTNHSEAEATDRRIGLPWPHVQSRKTIHQRTTSRPSKTEDWDPHDGYHHFDYDFRGNDLLPSLRIRTGHYPAGGGWVRTNHRAPR